MCWRTTYKGIMDSIKPYPNYKGTYIGIMWVRCRKRRVFSSELVSAHHVLHNNIFPRQIFTDTDGKGRTDIHLNGCSFSLSNLVGEDETPTACDLHKWECGMSDPRGQPSGLPDGNESWGMSSAMSGQLKMSIFNILWQSKPTIPEWMFPL